jgi:deoxyribodipyrimidine photolyase-related protein
MIKTLRLILGDQLNAQHSWFERTDPAVLYVMAEIRQETDYVRHHIQKICGIFAAMRRFCEAMQSKGHQFKYYRILDNENPHTFAGILDQLCDEHSIQSIEIQYPDEFRLWEEFSQYRHTRGLKVQFTESGHFIIPFEKRNLYLSKGRLPIMEHFYRRMRRETGILMENNHIKPEPVGGTWNYDRENRKKLPANFTLPERQFEENDVAQIHEEVLASGCAWLGEIEPTRFIWPIDREQALSQLRHFCTYSLPYFGTYQDAMTQKDDFLMHSRISFAMNCKLISPKEAIEQALESWLAYPEQISIAQVEGFVRQILGWREYVRIIYWAEMPEFSRLNVLNHHLPLPEFYWNGNTKMRCVQHAVKQSLQQGYAHHIQRLMVTGNLALLLGVHPDEVDQWYLGIYVDAFEWVEMPNTRGMSQYADGGIVGSKPYVSSARYIQSMSDYCSHCVYQPKERTTEMACPFNSLYWDFYLRHEDKLRNNPRIGMMYMQLDKMKDAEKKAIQEKAFALKQNANTL